MGAAKYAVMKTPAYSSPPARGEHPDESGDP